MQGWIMRTAGPYPYGSACARAFKPGPWHGASLTHLLCMVNFWNFNTNAQEPDGSWKRRGSKPPSPTNPAPLA